MAGPVVDDTPRVAGIRMAALEVPFFDLVTQRLEAPDLLLLAFRPVPTHQWHSSVLAAALQAPGHVSAASVPATGMIIDTPKSIRSPGYCSRQKVDLSRGRLIL
jgi:hypothetical protein